MQISDAWTCQYCGTGNIIADIFCSHCGFSINSSTLADQTILSKQEPPTSTYFTSSSSRRVTGSLGTTHLLEGRYRIVQIIGRGGFGVVYKATNERFPSKPQVAIKEMSDAQLSSKEKQRSIQDFRNEADLLAQLSHPNLPRVSDFFEDAGKAYLVMDFVQGRTLEDIQHDVTGPLDEFTVMGWALQLCQVLHYLHTLPQPIIFRDLKPSNIMVTPAGEIKLIDFGIARIFKLANTKDTTLLGSQGYAPLEQYGAGQSDARSDIYGLGTTLFDLLTKELPLDSPSRRVYPQKFVTPRQINPNISPAIEAIVLKAMGEDLIDRYQSALEMYYAITSAGIGTPTTAFTRGMTTLSPFTVCTKPSSLPPTAADILARRANKRAANAHSASANTNAANAHPTSAFTRAAQVQLPSTTKKAVKVQLPSANTKAAKTRTSSPDMTALESAYLKFSEAADARIAYVQSRAVNARQSHVHSKAFKAQQSHTQPKAARFQTKNWIIAFLLFIFLGWCGGHRFYTGRWVTGLLQLFTFGGWGIWLLIDLILLVTGNFTDSKGVSLYRPPIQGGQRSWVTTFLLFIFLGWCGGHRFYTGQWSIGFFQMFTLGGYGIWLLVDLIQLLNGSFRDKEGMLLTRVK